jgi:hypothetical protein
VRLGRGPISATAAHDDGVHDVAIIDPLLTLGCHPAKVGTCRLERGARSLSIWMGRLWIRPPASSVVIDTPWHDDRRALQQYAARYGATPPHRRVAAPADRGSLDGLLAFGVVVLPDGSGGLLHCSVVYLVDRRGGWRAFSMPMRHRG